MTQNALYVEDTKKNGYVFAEIQKIYGEQYRNLDEILDSEKQFKGKGGDLLKISLKLSR